MSPACHSDFIEVGYQPGEKVANCLRVLSFGVILLVAYTWGRKDNAGRHPLHFLSWLGAAFYIGSQEMLSLLVLNCWQSMDIAPLIYTLKFIELLGLNFNSISGLCMQITIYKIVRSYRGSKRVKASERPFIIIGVATALVATISSCVFWDTLLVTGGYFWVSTSSSPAQARWITLSFTAIQGSMGLLQLLCLLLTFRHMGDMKACMQSSAAFRSHVFVAGVTMISFLFTGVAGILDQTDEQFRATKLSEKCSVISWSARFLAMALQTFLLLYFEDLQTTTNNTGFRSSAGDPSLAATRRQTAAFPPLSISKRTTMCKPSSGTSTYVNVDIGGSPRSAMRELREPSSAGVTLLSAGRGLPERQKLTRIVPQQQQEEIRE